MKASRIIKPNESLQSQETETQPKGSHVLINLWYSGVCHNGIHLWKGGNNGSERQYLKTADNRIIYPLTSNHKIAVTVDALGDDAHSIQDMACYSFLAEINQMS